MEAILRALFGYLFLVFMVRVVGRRPGKQITPFEFLLVFFIGGIELTAMVGNDRSAINAVCQIITIACAHSALAWLKQGYPYIGRLLDGTPLVLVSKGKQQNEVMGNMRIDQIDVLAMGRDRGIANGDDIDYAVLERNGEISVLKARKKEEA